MISENGKTLGIDVGGSHISAAVISKTDHGWQPSFKTRIMLNSKDSAYAIITALSDCIKECVGKEKQIESVGIAFPGPFDYESGISSITDVGGKFEKTFGLHIKQGVEDLTGLSKTTFRFSNDAHSFATGAWHLYRLKSKRTVFITLGTGFGSAFMADGELLHSHPGIPASGAFFDQDFQDSHADDHFSSRWILNAAQNKSGTKFPSVKEFIESGTTNAQSVMEQFGKNLGCFLLPWLQKFQCDQLVIGGNIAKAFSLFESSLKKELGVMENKINVLITDNAEDCIVTGAALMAGAVKSPGTKTFRKSSQDVLPVTMSETGKDAYDIYPSFQSGKKINKGFYSLAEEIAGEKIIVIDGYGGVIWDRFTDQLHEALSLKKKTVFWYDITACMKPVDEIHDMITGSLNGDDPVFGKRYSGALSDFFDENKLKLISTDPSADICIVYGTGAALTGIKGKLIYIDVPKNEIQFRMRAGSIMNLGSNQLFENSQMYKRFYFVDWPVLNKHKAQLLPHIDFVIDAQREDEITWMEGLDFRNTLYQMLQQPFRARPWFERGVWGGNWMKKHIPGLNQEEVNYAWSFELITPENGIVLEGNKNLLEVSFDFLLYLDNKKLLGKAAQRFGTEFPIRFDFLDTFDGGNLSIQCHPQPAYAKEHFGEHFTQDETYYILDCEQGAPVYLGFQDDINPQNFKEALLDAQENGIEMEVERYVQKLPAKKHDLFLIPNGTVHASGKNNLVLEISSTPYIFTFKMYDWLRLDLSGQPRPINIEHAMNNLYFDRKGGYVTEKLISHPVVEEEWQEGRKLKLPTHEEHFYSVHRYEFTGKIQVNTNNQCHICMLVEGKNITVQANGSTNLFHYAETFVVPAATGDYEIASSGNEKVFLVIAKVKEEYC